MTNHTKYVGVERAKIYSNKSREFTSEALWGDQVIVHEEYKNGLAKVNVRGQKDRYMDLGDLNGKPLLEFYFIDVGQGDGVLIVTPDRKHLLVDGGYSREKQPHNKSAADFVDWKFYREAGKEQIELDAMICSHNDADHYGGLWDLLDDDKKEFLNAKHTVVHNFYHAGVSWWKNSKGERTLGKEEHGYLVDLLEDENSISQGLQSPSLCLQGEWAKFLECVLASKASVSRLAYNPKKQFDYLPGFEKDKNKVSIKILGPIEHIINGKPGVKSHGNNSQNTNGNSLLLRIDYGRARILLTGDLNKNSQHHLMEELAGSRQELAADVVKSCHHGSDDCSYAFMQLVQAGVTVISSGDDENHAHPRPNIIGTAGSSGYHTLKDDELITPLVFSTEVSRSYRIGHPQEVSQKGYSINKSKIDVTLDELDKVSVKYEHTKSGGLYPSKKENSMDRLKVVDGIVYGLVNVRTDGEKILCATLNEGKEKWEVKSFNSRF